MTATPRAEDHTPLPRPSGRLERFGRRQGWVVGVALLLAALVLWRSSQIPAFGAFEVRGIFAGTMTLALLAMAQSVIVISGGIDLSVGAMMVLANCIAARLMLDQDPQQHGHADHPALAAPEAVGPAARPGQRGGGHGPRGGAHTAVTSRPWAAVSRSVSDAVGGSSATMAPLWRTAARSQTSPISRSSLVNRRMAAPASASSRTRS